MSYRRLAIIIPYYKNDYIRESLKSIQNQTNRDFNLYIGDDASPYPINDLIAALDEDFKQRIIYNRFSQNLGGTSLIKQWERCIALSKHEDYIWLFSDDDIMPVNAVQRFYESINLTELTDVLRFNVSIINNEGNIIGEYQPHPHFESAEDFARRRLLGQCVSTACEYIFTRNIYEEKNRFVEFPLAWASDDATWIKFSEEKGIITIPGEPVLWRMSGLNISSDSEKTYKAKIKASILYLRFLNKKFHFNNDEKLDWLISQLNLLGNSPKIKKEFYSQLSESKWFSYGYLKKHFLKRRVKHYFSKIKKIVRNNR